MYYLKTRYYDPKTGRFITIDDISYLAPDTINGLNLYACRGNNPVTEPGSEQRLVGETGLVGLWRNRDSTHNEPVRYTLDSFPRERSADFLEEQTEGTIRKAR